MPDEVDLELPTGVEPPREGYDVPNLANRYVIGTPDEVARELKQIAEMGLDELLISGLDSIETLRKFAREVMPSVRG